MQPPEHDEICIYCFGPGYGESFVVHIGANQWIIIDSCILPGKRVAALWLLEEMGVDPAKSVNQFIITHWHDDHIRGAGRIAAECRIADVILPAVFSKKEFTSLAHLFGKNSASDESYGTNEVVAIFEQAGDRIGYASENTIIEDKAVQVCGKSARFRLYGISPSRRQITNFIKGLSGYIPDVSETKRKLPDNPTNEASLATVLVVNDIGIIFGADLEDTAGFPGWTDALSNWKIPVQSFSFFKIAHHGGLSGHSADLWTNYLIQNVFGVVAPWNRGTKLPQETDLERIRFAKQQLLLYKFNIGDSIYS